MELRRYLAILRRRALLIALAMIVAVGFTGSLIVAGLLALIAETMRNGLRSTREIERALGVSCLSHVPRIKGAFRPHEYPTAWPPPPQPPATAPSFSTSICVTRACVRPRASP